MSWSFLFFRLVLISRNMVQNFNQGFSFLSKSNLINKIFICAQHNVLTVVLYVFSGVSPTRFNEHEHPLFQVLLWWIFSEQSLNENLLSLLFQRNCLEFASYRCMRPQTSRDTICTSDYAALLSAACVKRELDKLYRLFGKFASLM